MCCSLPRKCCIYFNPQGGHNIFFNDPVAAETASKKMNIFDNIWTPCKNFKHEQIMPSVLKYHDNCMTMTRYEARATRNAFSAHI